MIYGAILAGGIGKRMEKHTIPKQFISIGGIPIIVMTLRAFVENDRIDVIYIAVHKDWNEYLHKLLELSFSEQERSRIVIVNGGKERLDSFTNIMDDIITKNGLNKNDILICHDAVRPFVRQQMINDCIEATEEDGIALTVIPAVDTVHVTHEEKFIDGTLERNGLYNGQTPSGFNIKLLKDACDHFTEEEKSKVTGTTQLMLKLGYKLRIVKGHTSNFKITTDNDLDVADRIIRAEKKTRGIELLDCTLRDGGIVIDFNFGSEQMKKIKECLENSGVEYIECGYIDEKNGSNHSRTCFDSEQSIKNTLLSTGKKSGITYVAMIDYGAYDVNKLQPRDDGGVDGIRLAFHKEVWRDAIEWGKVIIQKGYQLYIQPMVSMRYDDDEFLELIRICNIELSDAKGFYIVDSFGQMDSMMLLHKLELADQYVKHSMKIGLHAHNNRQMAYSNALTFITYNAKHNIMLDASIMGMGKGAGNVCTELIMASLIQEGKFYDTNSIYASIAEYFSAVQKESPWGYSLDYYLSSLYTCTPSYIKIFLKDERVTTDILVTLLKSIPEDKKAACDKVFARKHLEDFFSEVRWEDESV